MTTRNRIEAYYRAHPNASLDDVLAHLGRKKTPSLMRMICAEQSKLRKPRPAEGLAFVGWKQPKGQYDQ